MTIKQQIADADRYISHARRQIHKQQRVINRSQRKETICKAQDLVLILSAMLANVEHRREILATSRKHAIN